MRFKVAGCLQKVVVLAWLLVSLLSRATLVVIFLGTVLFAKAPEPATSIVSLQQVLNMASQNSEAYRAIEEEQAAVRAEVAARDLISSPSLSVDLSTGRDNRDSLSRIARRSGSTLLDSTYRQPFSTGTSLVLGVGHELADIDESGQRNIGQWEASITQSLWRDAFGRSTRLRHQAEADELKSRLLLGDYQKLTFLRDVEAAYWDLALAQQEELIRQSNIERSKTLIQWTRDRVQRSAAEPVDLLQAQSLLSLRTLELAEVRNRIEDLQNRFRQLIPDQQPSRWKLDLSALETKTSIDQALLTNSSPSNLIRLDALSLTYRSDQAESESMQISDSLRPRLDAYLSHGQNGIDEQMGEAWSRASSTESSATRVGVLFALELDRGLINKRRDTARLNASSSALKAQALTRESQVGWEEIRRQIKSLSLRIDEARKLTDLQQKKIEAERRRYRLGRSTVFQLIAFEVDAASAQLQLYRLLSELRKVESEVKLYAQAESVVK